MDFINSKHKVTTDLKLQKCEYVKHVLLYPTTFSCFTFCQGKQNQLLHLHKTNFLIRDTSALVSHQFSVNWVTH